MNSLKKLALPIALVAITAGATNALGANLSVIPVLWATNTVNEGRAITPDGKYVVGISGGNYGYLYQVGSASAINVLSTDGAQSTLATGVGYRYYSGQQQLLVHGLTTSGNTDYMTTDGGTTFARRRDTNLGPSPWSIPAANSLASSASDVYYSVFRDNNNYLRVGKAWGAWPPASNTMTLMIDTKSVPTGESATFNGISSTGRAVGKRGPRNYVMDWTGAGSGSVWFPTGLQGNQTGQVFSVSANGTILFGHSPVSDGRPGNWGYKEEVSGDLAHTFVSIDPLPVFGNEAGSTSRQIPYGCTPDGGIAVGMAYRGTEKAVLWDTTDPNPANWWVLDLTSLAQSEGILDGFTRLTRAYSVGVDPVSGNRVITGVGAWSPDGGVTPYTTRAFVMSVIPEPTTGALVALGGLLLALCRRK